MQEPMSVGAKGMSVHKEHLTMYYTLSFDKLQELLIPLLANSLLVELVKLMSHRRLSYTSLV